MKNFIKKTVILLSAIILTACFAVYIAISVVDYNAKNSPEFKDVKQDNTPIYQTGREPDINNQKKIIENQDIETAKEIQYNNNEDKEITNEKKEATVKETAKQQIEKYSTQKPDTKSTKKTVITSDEINEIISKMSFSEKWRIMKKLMSKLSAKDISYFWGLAKNGITQEKMSEAGKKLLSLFNEKELEELKAIYEKYKNQ